MVSSSAPAPPSAGTEDHRSPARKKARHDHAPPGQDHRDWISALPDEILVLILSRLPIRDAAITSCLAARWRHLWKSVPKLIVGPRTIGMREQETGGDVVSDARAAEFIRKMDSLLLSRGATGVEQFRLISPLTSAHEAEAERWWAALAESATRLKEFTLAAAGKTDREATGGDVEPYDFPLHWLATVGSQLRLLLLVNCGLMMAPPAPAMGPAPAAFGRVFASLEVVKLVCVSATDSAVLTLLGACGALTKLRIHYCHQIVNLRLSHARLRLLDVDRCRQLDSVRIRAPALLELRYTGHRIAMDYAHAPLLRRLELLLVPKNHCPLDCLGAARDHPKLRTLLLQFPSPLAVSPDQLRHDRRFAGLRRVGLFLVGSWNEGIASVAYLLQAAPLVRELLLEAYSGQQPVPEKKLKITWPKGCSLKRLRSVSIGGFSGEPELTALAIFLLRSSPGLKLLAVDTRRRWRHGDNKKGETEETEQDLWRGYVRETALAKLTPSVPSKVKLTIC